jgi:hypothetical protein
MTTVHQQRRAIAAAALSATMALTFSAAAPASAAPTAPGTPEATVVGQGGPGAIKDSYIVVLRAGNAEARGVSTAASSLTKRYGGTVRHSYTHSVRGFSTKLSSAAARRLAADPSVAYVEQDRTLTINTTQTNPPWGVDRIDQRSLPLSRTFAYPGTTANVTAYILDTGLRTTHTDFNGRARSGRDFVDNDAVANDCNGHGTHVAGTVGGRRYGVAKQAKLVGVRVLNCAGSGSYSGIIAGVDWVTANAVKPAVANMSLGGSAVQSLDDAVNRSIASGVTYALAAGNDGGNACLKSPARTPAAITVGATDSADRKASFSNIGTCLDLFAPGVNIVSTAYASDTATATLSGTSMAAPHAAGAAAIVLAAAPTATPAQVRAALVAGATPNKVSNAGTGSPNRLLFTGVTVAR